MLLLLHFNRTIEWPLSSPNPRACSSEHASERWQRTIEAGFYPTLRELQHRSEACSELHAQDVLAEFAKNTRTTICMGLELPDQKRYNLQSEFSKSVLIC